MAMNLKPHPIVVSQVCSLCGLDWPRHGDSPTGKTCIDLLKADLQTARVQLAHRPFVQPIPYVPWPRWPQHPTGYPALRTGGNARGSITYGLTTNQTSPPAALTAGTLTVLNRPTST